MIQFEQVCKRYPGGHQALNNLSFHMPHGDMRFLTGHSGAGKSTLLKLIMVMERANSGQVLIDGRNVSKLPARHIPELRRKVGVVFQNHQLLFDRSVFDNVALPLVIAGYGHRDIGRRVRAALDKVGLLDKERQNPITLSGGEQQRVGIARAVVNKPKLLLADEPTGNLDTNHGEEVMRMLQQLNAEGSTIVMVTHSPAHADYASRVVNMLDGRILQERRRAA